LTLKDSAERLKQRVQELRQEVRGVVENLGGAIPRPLRERIESRPTLILREPLIKQLRRRRKKL